MHGSGGETWDLVWKVSCNSFLPHIYIYIYIYQGAPGLIRVKLGLFFLRSRLDWVTFVKYVHGFARVGLARFRVSTGSVRSGLSGFGNLLEGERSGFEAGMHKVVHKPTI